MKKIILFLCMSCLGQLVAQDAVECVPALSDVQPNQDQDSLEFSVFFLVPPPQNFPDSVEIKIFTVDGSECLFVAYMDQLPAALVAVGDDFSLYGNAEVSYLLPRENDTLRCPAPLTGFQDSVFIPRLPLVLGTIRKTVCFDESNLLSNGKFWPDDFGIRVFPGEYVVNDTLSVDETGRATYIIKIFDVQGGGGLIKITDTIPCDDILVQGFLPGDSIFRERIVLPGTCPQELWYYVRECDDPVILGGGIDTSYHTICVNDVLRFDTGREFVSNIAGTYELLDTLNLDPLETVLRSIEVVPSEAVVVIDSLDCTSSLVTEFDLSIDDTPYPYDTLSRSGLCDIVHYYYVRPPTPDTIDINITQDSLLVIATRVPNSDLWLHNSDNICDIEYLRPTIIADDFCALVDVQLMDDGILIQETFDGLFNNLSEITFRLDSAVVGSIRGEDMMIVNNTLLLSPGDLSNIYDYGDFIPSGTLILEFKASGSSNRCCSIELVKSANCELRPLVEVSNFVCEDEADISFSFNDYNREYELDGRTLPRLGKDTTFTIPVGTHTFGFSPRDTVCSGEITLTIDTIPKLARILGPDTLSIGQTVTYMIDSLGQDFDVDRFDATITPTQVGEIMVTAEITVFQSPLGCVLVRWPKKW